MAPGGLIISKLALHASVDEEVLKGLLCMKISIPKDVDGGQVKLPLFPETSPQYLSQHQILPLPLTPAHLASRPIYTASILLSLSSAPGSQHTGNGMSSHVHDYSSNNISPTPSSSSRIQVQVETTRPEGPVYIAVQGGKRRRPSTGSNGSSGYGGAGSAGGARLGSASGPGVMGGARREYLVCMQVEHDIQRQDGRISIHLPLPKCLDNALRLHILPPRSGPSAYAYEETEISLVSEPKILPIPGDPFQALSGMSVAMSSRDGRSSADSRGNGVGNGDVRQSDQGKARRYSNSGSWADGETDASGSEAWGTDDDDELGSWVEGRFHSTDKLKLEWTYIPTTPIPHLHLSPDLADRSIGFVYECSLPSDSQGMREVPVRLELPDGWGVSELAIQADGLSSFSCAEDDALSASRPLQTSSEIADETADDSFTTVLASNNRRAHPADSTHARPQAHAVRSSASLMHQTLPAGDSMRIDDFSFEMGDESREAAAQAQAQILSRPGTPAGGAVAAIGRSGRQSLGGGEYGDEQRGEESEVVKVQLPRSRAVEAREVALHFDRTPEEAQGSGVRITGTLVPLRSTLLLSPSVPTPCPVLTLGGVETSPFEMTTDLSPDDAVYVSPPKGVPNIEWHDASGAPLQLPAGAEVAGLEIKVNRDVWGKQSAMVEFDWIAGGEAVLLLPYTRGSRPANQGEVTKGTERADMVGEEEPEVRVVSASAAGRALQHAIARTEEGWAVVLGSAGRRSPASPKGKTRVLLESPSMGSGSDRVLLVYCREARQGEMRVELVGDHWPDMSAAKTNLITLIGSLRSYTLTLPSTSLPYILLPSTPTTVAPASSLSGTSMGWKSRIKSSAGLLSWSTLLNLFLLYLLVSLAQRVQRIGYEVGFITDEFADLRQYASVRYESPAASAPADATGPPLASVRSPVSGTTAADEVQAGHTDRSDSGRRWTESGASSDLTADCSAVPSQVDGSDAAIERGRHGGHAGSIWEEQQVAVGERHDGAHAQGSGASESGDSHRSEGLPRYDWQGKGAAQMVREMPRYEYTSVGGRAGTADPMAIGRVVVGQTAWDKLTAHPTIRSIEQSLKWVWGTFIWLLNPGQ